MTTTRIPSIKSMTAAKDLAEAAAGFRDEPLTFTVEGGGTVDVPLDYNYTLLRCVRDGREIGATVTLARPQHDFGRVFPTVDGPRRSATVTHSSSSSNDTGVDAALVTIQLLQLAVDAAKLLDQWDSAE